MSIEEIFKFTTAEESVTDKDWAAGSKDRINSTEFVIERVAGTTTYTAEYKTVKYAPAWHKIIDECIVNALDHIIRTGKVTTIKISFDKTGRVRVYNDGPGIDVVIHKEASEKLKKTVYLLELIFGHLFQGSNRVRAADSIIGGTNGLGAKLANCFSAEFIAETSTGSKYMVKRWRNHMSQPEDPIIVDLTHPNNLDYDRTHPHTKVSFMPDYTGLFGYERFGDAEYNELVGIVRMRAALASVYANHAQKGINVWFNDELLPFKTAADITSVLFRNVPTVRTLITPTIDPKKRSLIHYKYAWEVVCAVVPVKATSNQLTIVNGVVVRSGNHTVHIRKLISTALEDKISKLLNEKEAKHAGVYIQNNMFVFITAQIPNPAWTGQRKDELVVDIKKFANYSLDTKFLSKLTESMQERITAEILANIPTANGKKNTKITYEKYTGALLCNTKHALECTLIAVEGDSAMTQVSTGIANTIGFEKYGVISLGGVIMNVRKQCTVIETPTGNYVKNSNKLENNVLINALLEITGLNPNYKYDPKSPTYKKEMSELRYGHLCAYVDQDHDGKGGILGQILNLFDMFFPNLSNAGYLQWQKTAIARAFPKRGGKVIEFYSMIALNTWASKANLSQWNIEYYKGIGTHSREQIISMFKRFNENLYTFRGTDKEVCEIYFGDNPDLRKVELAKPSRVLSTESQLNQDQTRTILVRDHIEIETNAYQKDNLERKLDHVIDGQNQAGRMILDAFLKAFKKNDPIKVASLAGYVSQHENYLHGEDSLADSITGKGLVTPGGKQLPFIVPLSNFGSRKGGGNDASPPRYIYTKLNKKLTDLLFPAVDYEILQFKDDVDSCEPKYFVPIIPLAVIESTMLPAHGWQLKTWGRDVFKVIANVRRLIRLGDDAPLLNMPPCTYAGAPYAWKGEFKTIRGELYSFGKYVVESPTDIYINELPLRVWTTPYVAMLKKKALDPNSLIDTVNDYSDDMRVRIHVKLKQGALERLAEYADSYYADGVEEYLQLRDHMNLQLNMMNMDGGVSEFKNYEDIFRVWFPVRREYYRKRIERQLILLKLRIKYVDNIIRYSREETVQGLKRAEKLARIEAAGFTKFYRARLEDPGFNATDKLESLILGEDASYDYLTKLNDEDRYEESIAKREIELEKLKSELDTMNAKLSAGRFVGAVEWDEELSELETTIREGQRTFWQFEDFGKFIYE